MTVNENESYRSQPIYTLLIAFVYLLLFRHVWDTIREAKQKRSTRKVLVPKCLLLNRVISEAPPSTDSALILLIYPAEKSHGGSTSGDKLWNEKTSWISSCDQKLSDEDARQKRLQESHDFIWWQRWHLSVSARIVSEEGEKSFLREDQFGSIQT